MTRCTGHSWIEDWAYRARRHNGKFAAQVARRRAVSRHMDWIMLNGLHDSAEAALAAGRLEAERRHEDDQGREANNEAHLARML